MARTNYTKLYSANEGVFVDGEQVTEAEVYTPIDPTPGIRATPTRKIHRETPVAPVKNSVGEKNDGVNTLGTPKSKSGSKNDPTGVSRFCYCDGGTP